MEQIPRPDANAFPFRSAILGLFAVQSAIGLLGDREIGGVILELSGQRPIADDIDYFGTIVDSLFLVYATSTLFAQAGFTNKEDQKSPTATMNNMEAQLTLNVGREQGTWMPKDWAASGARLSLPMKVCASWRVSSHDQAYLTCRTPHTSTLHGARSAGVWHRHTLATVTPVHTSLSQPPCT